MCVGVIYSNISKDDRIKAMEEWYIVYNEWVGLMTSLLYLMKVDEISSTIVKLRVQP